MFTLSGRLHRHKDLENALLELSKDVSTIRLELASIRGKLAVSVRDNRKKSGIDAEIAMLEEQLGGKAVAYKDESGQFHLPNEENNAV